MAGLIDDVATERRIRGSKQGLLSEKSAPAASYCLKHGSSDNSGQGRVGRVGKRIVDLEIANNSRTLLRIGHAS